MAWHDLWLKSHDISTMVMVTDGLLSSSLRWRHNGRDGVSNHQPHHCLFNRLFGRSSKKTSKLRVTGLCVGNSSGTGEFPTQMASNAEDVSIWWHHHGDGYWWPVVQLAAWHLQPTEKFETADAFFYLWLTKVSANERIRYICNVFSNWLRPLSAINRKRTQKRVICTRYKLSAES